MLPAAEAEAKILDLVPLPTEVEQVSLDACLGRVLAKAIPSPLDFPHWDNSAMDGYAVRYEDVQGASAEQPKVLTLTETIPAGRSPQLPIGSGQAARILTGSMLPDGADTIVIQEVTQRQGDSVLVLETPEPQQFVRHRGSFCRAGEALMAPGLSIGGPELAVLASAQCLQVPVFPQPRVAILSTGDELVMPDAPLQPGQIVDSNQYALAALVRQAGAIPLSLGIVPDQPQALRTAIQSALAQADMIVSSGGVSVGDYDYVDEILAELGATLHIRSVAVKPGKPLTVATFPAEGGNAPLYFGLPGNPVSALVTFWRFVAPALRKRSGLATGWGPTFVPATTRDALKAGGQRETYLWGKLETTAQGYEFSLAGGGHNSGNLINLAGTNALAVVPVGTKLISAEATVPVMVVGS
ncbi:MULTISPECIES: molybdopterin molybdotransferase MoeA [Cyanophyceae]|uniref:Molybdopterin molybdenumtransferase n=1 Tax=Leptolyngbya subtilissima DQ-A4 TaxID=2933933 RepID=A0ABV0K3P5_9CYAN|nr:gephyrin-like molybdotransferase Glp [Nodosilinea sp. FACHB-141]MBD2113363.1 molybdopterin molybdotransferase MoeA [Nodosilinea sp. FACHB-141]